jgi:hypothetical protein
MGLDVVGKLSKWEKVSPIVCLVVAEDSKELLNFLIDAFHFSISLRMKHCGQGLINVEFVPGFVHKF